MAPAVLFRPGRQCGRLQDNFGRFTGLGRSLAAPTSQPSGGRPRRRDLPSPDSCMLGGLLAWTGAQVLDRGTGGLGTALGSGNRWVLGRSERGGDPCTRGHGLWRARVGESCVQA